jgi:hypothetical protein
VLRRAGFYVEVFEQDRIIGGRMATTRLGIVPFDHGAQYVTARTSQFGAYIDEMVGAGYATRWHPKAIVEGKESVQLLPWFVGTPGMASIVRPLTESVRIHVNRKVHTVSRLEKGWHICFDDETSVGTFSALAITVPAPQARLLLGRYEELVHSMGPVRMSPCWALLVRLEERHFPEQDVYSDMSETIRWIGRNSTKPGRNTRGETIVIHASQSWSRETEDAEPDLVAEELWSEVSNLLALPPVRPAQMSAHLWSHGLVDQPLGETYLYSSEYKIGAAGDWCTGRLAEHAFDSGTGLGRAIAASLN